MPAIVLPEPQVIETPLTAALAKRASAKAFSPEPLTLQSLSDTLSSISLRNHKLPRRTYPSGGGLYPIESYVLAFNVEGLERNVFHYSGTNSLSSLWPLGTLEPEDILHPHVLRQPHLKDAAAALVFTAVWPHTIKRYASFGYILSLLEAGHAAQNILLAASALELAAHPCARIDTTGLATLLDIDEKVEQPIYAIMLGEKTVQK